MQTALEASQNDRRLRIAMMRLLDGLRGWVRVYTRNEADMPKLPEHDVVWVAGMQGEGPEKMIMDAIAQSPELWAHALPAECVIVHRETLKKYVGKDATEYMAGYGAIAVAEKAARLYHEAEQKRRERT